MSISEMLVREFDKETSKSQKTLERVPADKWDWKPHEKSGSLGWMAGHVASLPGFGVLISTASEFDIANAKPPKVEKGTDLLALLAKTSGEARSAISRLTDAQMQESWSLKNGDRTIFSQPRYDMLRDMCFNHIIHHRGQLTVYYRLNDVPVPGLYGPSADEKNI